MDTLSHSRQWQTVRSHLDAPIIVAEGRVPDDQRMAPDKDIQGIWMCHKGGVALVNPRLPLPQSLVPTGGLPSRTTSTASQSKAGSKSGPDTLNPNVNPATNVLPLQKCFSVFRY